MSESKTFDNKSQSPVSEGQDFPDDNRVQTELPAAWPQDSTGSHDDDDQKDSLEIAADDWGYALTDKYIEELPRSTVQESKTHLSIGSKTSYTLTISSTETAVIIISQMQAFHGAMVARMELEVHIKESRNSRRPLKPHVTRVAPVLFEGTSEKTSNSIKLSASAGISPPPFFNLNPAVTISTMAHRADNETDLSVRTVVYGTASCSKISTQGIGLSCHLFIVQTEEPSNPDDDLFEIHVTSKTAIKAPFLQKLKEQLMEKKTVMTPLICSAGDELPAGFKRPDKDVGQMTQAELDQLANNCLMAHANASYQYAINIATAGNTDST
ncbi:hypothetical protein TREMEDRAFT_64378 [Tremella mesenterica DSM 1558]|uniref:uncharacterized protein n=1 Tax=Tremella mesenterica (strain ATCC 24925 / CBS 8224 / DSM 1558 / NBRC 9311 / NRRL Y-6157 / RJB 2259-6 / UBC 559-6) TaxID=578456 RepID=UPI0003F49494|nr:uncharacterized protein TREMEDRAFT_64378 [Tremella mesenterica DSM 1558]EIW67783.1 hypothetical protein TREMEDRAFT_64378 [Tremella mesenterica DSM 1558]